MDFVLTVGSAPSLAIECKYQREVGEGEAAALATSGGGLILTRSTWGSLADSAVYALPVAAFLAAVSAPVLASLQS